METEAVRLLDIERDDENEGERDADRRTKLLDGDAVLDRVGDREALLP